MSQPQQPPHNHLPSFLTYNNNNNNNNSDTYSIISNEDDEDDEYEQQQLISNLLSSSTSTCTSACSWPCSETTSFPFQQVKFVSYPYFLPFDSTSASSYITINGNEETCGSSFSDTDSSVMASFDTTAAFHFSHAEFFGARNDVTLKARDLHGDHHDDDDEEEEDAVWDWSAVPRQN